MKKIFKSIVTGLLVATLFTLVPFEGECREISNNVFRVHILANSDSDADQNLKLKVRDALIEVSEDILKDTKSKDEALGKVYENLDLLETVASDVVLSAGYDYPVQVSVTNMYFDTRYYGSVTMPGGFYDALRVEIGKAQGKNWWCVMYPSLCLYTDCDTSALKDNLSDKQYGIVTEGENYVFRFKVVEIFSSLCSKFNS